MSSNSIGVLQKLHDELRDVPDPLKNWKQVSSIFAGIEVVLATEYTTHVQQFQKLVTVTFSTRRGYSISLGDGNNYDERDRIAMENLRINESIAKTTVEKVVKFVETIISLSLRRATDSPLELLRVGRSTLVFVVHGHDHEMKQSVARVLEKLKLTPIILHEQPDGGKTIIEKFEKNASEVGFAIVLMSPDDLGYSKTDGSRKAKPRARQNVVIELGYFIGKLGRDKVMVLKRGDVEEPSDINGVVYTPFDDHDGWQQKLVRELRAAGYTVDANSL